MKRRHILKMSENFLFTVPSGEPVSIEPFHYAIVGQTQFSGKTTLIKRLASWAKDNGFKVLIFDTKETEADYAGFGREVPVCLRETTDSFVLIGLLESMFRRRLTSYYATLSRLTEGAKGFNDIIERAKEMEAKTRSSWLRDACRVLYDLLERLQAETAKVKTVPRLQLYDGINRMVINEFSLEAQQLIVKNAFEDALRIYKRNLIIVLDEAFKFLPQGYSSPATKAVMHVITQGAKTGLYVWISTQFLAVTDKDPLKACAIKFLGTQDHITEVRHTLDLIPEVRGRFKPDDIMKLKLGHWILVRKRPPDVRIVYALPLGVPSNLGRRVASGELTPEYICDNFLKIKEVEEELVWKEKYENLKRDMERRIREEREKAFQEAMRKLNEIKSKWNIEEMQKTILQLKDENATLKRELKRAEKASKLFKEFANILMEYFPSQKPEAMAKSVRLGLDHTEMHVTIKHKEETVSLKTDTVLGKVMYAAVNEFRNKEFTERELTEILLEHGWNVKHSTLAPSLANLVKNGWLIRIPKTKPARYRLPKKLKIEIKKE